jgi:hypothetical protein
MMAALRALGAGSAGCASVLRIGLAETVLAAGPVGAVRWPSGMSSSLSDIAESLDTSFRPALRSQASQQLDLQSYKVLMDGKNLDECCTQTVTMMLDRKLANMTPARLARLAWMPAFNCPTRGHLITPL